MAGCLVLQPTEAAVFISEDTVLLSPVSSLVFFSSRLDRKALDWACLQAPLWGIVRKMITCPLLYHEFNVSIHDSPGIGLELGSVIIYF